MGILRAFHHTLVEHVLVRALGRGGRLGTVPDGTNPLKGCVLDLTV